jgi:hypothetical protein
LTHSKRPQATSPCGSWPHSMRHSPSWFRTASHQREPCELGTRSVAGMLQGRRAPAGRPCCSAQGSCPLQQRVFTMCGRILIAAFTTDPEVIRAGVSLLAIAAVFQLFDGLQGVATGILRGLGDTRTPMMWNLAGHWIGLPLGYALCFAAGLGGHRSMVQSLTGLDHLWNSTARNMAATRPQPLRGRYSDCWIEPWREYG